MDVAYQFAELGKVDVRRRRNHRIHYGKLWNGSHRQWCSCSVACMLHGKLTSKADIYEAYKGYKAFIEEMK